MPLVASIEEFSVTQNTLLRGRVFFTCDIIRLGSPKQPTDSQRQRRAIPYKKSAPEQCVPGSVNRELGPSNMLTEQRGPKLNGKLLPLNQHARYRSGLRYPSSLVLDRTVAESRSCAMPAHSLSLSKGFSSVDMAVLCRPWNRHLKSIQCLLWPMSPQRATGSTASRFQVLCFPEQGIAFKDFHLGVSNPKCQSKLDDLRTGDTLVRNRASVGTPQPSAYFF